MTHSSESPTLCSTETSFLQSSMDLSGEGNRCKIQEIVENLHEKLERLEIKDEAELLKRIDESQSIVQKYRDEGSEGELKEAMAILLELKDLKELSDNIHALNEGLEKHDLVDVDELPDKIKETGTRIEKLDKQGKVEKMDREKMVLQELQQLQQLHERILAQWLGASTCPTDSQSELDRLQRRLREGLEKYDLEDIDELLDKIKEIEDRIEKFEKQGKVQKANKEKTIIGELRELQQLHEKVRHLQSGASASVSDQEPEQDLLRERLHEGLRKYELEDVDELSDKIEEIDNRIGKLEKQGKTEKANKEKVVLRELQELQRLHERILDLQSVASVSFTNPDSEPCRLQRKLREGFEKYELDDFDELSDKIEETENQIKKLEKQGKTEKANIEKEVLRGLQELKQLHQKISDSQANSAVPDIHFLTSPPPQTVTDDEPNKKSLHCEELSDDCAAMPPCAERTTMELLLHFQGITTTDSTTHLLQRLKEQAKRQELLSEEVRASLLGLESMIQNKTDDPTVQVLERILKKMRPLNVHDVRRLVGKAQKAAELIRNKDVVLLIGATGAGKSTTIQFLAGATMTETRVEVAPGRFLEHITAIDVGENPDLKYITSSPLNKSETRYIAPVTVPLNKVIGHHATGDIILCDAPGFGDTAGPEVDIANSVAVVKALKGCKSVKLFALSSYKGLGDRGQGIQKLAHLLVNMVVGIEDRLDSIFYGFTKYPEKMDINALLLDVKTSKVDTDAALRSDGPFVIVLSDMIEKTEDGAHKIDPIHSDRKTLIKSLSRLPGIRNPDEAFRFSLSEETLAVIVDQAKVDKLNIICALKNKDIDLVQYYLNNLQTLTDLVEQNVARDAYEGAKRCVHEHIIEYFTEAKRKFNRVLASQDGLKDEDVGSYKAATQYIQETEKLTEHLGSSIVSSEAFVLNISSQLQEIFRTLENENLCCASVKIYLDNFLMLQNSFGVLKSEYIRTRQVFKERFEQLVESSRELVLGHKFSDLAEIFFITFKSSQVLKHYLGDEIEERYRKSVKSFLDYLHRFNEKVDTLLAKTRLSHEDMEVLKDCMDVLRSARNTYALQERVTDFIKMTKDGESTSSKDRFQDLNEIFCGFIAKIVKYFDDINIRIKELFDNSGDRALDSIEKLVTDMDILRSIPELESKTAESYHRTVANISGYTLKLQKDAEQLLATVGQQTGVTNYSHLARSLSRLKSAEWISRVSPDTYDSLLHHITEDLVQCAQQLDDRLRRLDLTLKCPDSICVAQEIIEKIDSMSVLERYIPELETYRTKISQHFLDSTKGTFDLIQKTFNLQDQTLYKIKQELNELEEIRRKYESAHPARLFLRNHEYSDVNALDDEIQDLTKREQTEQDSIEKEREAANSEVAELQSLVQRCVSQGIRPVEAHNAFVRNELKKSGCADIEAVYKAIIDTRTCNTKRTDLTERKCAEICATLARLRRIKDQYDSLLKTHDHGSPEEIEILHKNKYDSRECLGEAIEKKKSLIAVHEAAKQPFVFSDKLDGSCAENALKYIANCEKVTLSSVKEMAADTNAFLRKYTREYGEFLRKEINNNLKCAKTVGIERGSSQYAHDLERRVRELSSLSKYPTIFTYIEGEEKIETFKREFFDYYRDLAGKMEGDKVSGLNRDLREKLIISLALSCLDRFCVDVFATDGFGTLYRKYQGDVNQECKAAYKVVIEHISKGDYANADLALSIIDEQPLFPRDLAQIKHELQTSLSKLIRDTKSVANCLDGNIEREKENRSEIKEIRESIEKIRTALNKKRLMDLLIDSDRDEFQKFDMEIATILTSIFSKCLDSIDEFIGANSFSEAEQGMENLNRVQRELANVFTSDTVNKRIQELRGKLNAIATNILKGKDFSDTTKYSSNSPKDLLEKLRTAASHGNVKYSQAYNVTSENVRKSFSKAIDEVRNRSYSERSKAVGSLKYAILFLPEEMKQEFTLQIDEMHKLITDEEDGNKRDLEGLFKNEKEIDRDIMKIGELIQRYTKNKMPEFLQTLRTMTSQHVLTYQSNIESSLESQDMQSAVDIFKKVPKLMACIGADCREVQQVHVNICDLMIRHIETCADNIASIAKMQQAPLIEGAFRSVAIYMKFAESMDGTPPQLLAESTFQKVKVGFQTMCDFLWANSSKYRRYLEEISVSELCEVVSISKRWDDLLQEIRRTHFKQTSLGDMFNKMNEVASQKDMIIGLQSLIDQRIAEVNVELVSDKTTRFERDRDEFFNNLMQSIQVLREMHGGFRDTAVLILNPAKIEEDLKRKVEKLGDQLRDLLRKFEPTRENCDRFWKFYSHLLSFKKCVDLPGFDVSHFLSEADDKLTEKMSSLCREVTDAGSDAQKVANVLIEMKSLAENVPMFNSKFNKEIDGSLRAFKEKQGPTGVMQLSMVLEQNDVGMRLISEHTTLAGEDWRIRRIKMQNQDNLDYVLKELKGDDLAPDILKKRFEDFRTIYDDLLKAVLRSFKPDSSAEPDIGALISKTKFIADDISPKHSSTTSRWSQSFKDRIPELLAHIFAVWTLKNTQHYNETRGIEKGREYLLMPHAAQVTAILRILGTGYFRDRKIPFVNISCGRVISEDLVNNIVEIGTGEGKSVVVAVTACFFALVGVDVNCSCHSDVLSSRDRDDFAPLFNALGISERIEYGTFNTLCENLLNEQCNVREKVRSMILKNENKLAVAGTAKLTRAKVLLIDEVDVFLSEKYYGGIYSPSVYLKDPCIKKLLDAIWQEKNPRTLSRAKALPAYEECTARFSNWIFLIDEAVKDMLAALQSYRSTTYIVQDDRIVYVEGESIVDNVALGYDTIWAYYYENEKKTINSDSLEAHVGIVVNCGAFSYAEMPHSFSYISGVSGTLKTLTASEIEVLKTVYGIQRQTFMPSVFGRSNRNYNAMNDVLAVEGSEYFMKIRGEIDVICNAKRAILVFFESEENLMKFYNSDACSKIGERVIIISESTSVNERKSYINRASSIGSVTLLTRIFGRGTDFICRSQQLLANGGVHVLQTFFSKEVSEEYQIMGRGARQGDSGSYRMILLDKDLEWVLGAAWHEELPKIRGSHLYESLNSARIRIYESNVGAKKLGIEQCKSDHKASLNFMAALSNGDMDAVKQFLLAQNRGPTLANPSSRTVLLMDATGSMSSLLTATKETVCTMFERASVILKEKGLPYDAFQMQFVVYRDYDCGKDKLLQSSAWETNPNNLRSFMNRISAQGGGDYEEAIEIGLWHAVQESEQPDGISQVILIGDAPAKEIAAIERDRKAKGGDRYWKNTRFGTPTYFMTELQRLKERKVPVHAFYLDKGAKDNFEQIASETGGRCKSLNIQSHQGAEFLTDYVTEEVLRKSAGDQGDALVELYRKKYSKKTFTS